MCIVCIFICRSINRGYYNLLQTCGTLYPIYTTEFLSHIINMVFQYIIRCMECNMCPNVLLSHNVYINKKTGAIGIVTDFH